VVVVVVVVVVGGGWQLPSENKAGQSIYEIEL
jgi:hypothetical protein